jgi:hypothetical protein
MLVRPSTFIVELIASRPISHVYMSLAVLEAIADYQPQCIHLTGSPDPMYHPLLRSVVLRTSRSHTTVWTKGDYYYPAWWCELARQLGRNSQVNFSISDADGDAVNNVRAFVSTGGHAAWRFVSNLSNKHLLESHRKRAESIGAHFVIDDFDNILETLCPKNSNKLCKSVAASNVYVTVDGLLFPCAWASTDAGVAALLEKHGYSSISVMHNSISEILHGEVFREINMGISKGTGRVAACSSHCLPKNKAGH